MNEHIQEGNQFGAGSLFWLTQDAGETHSVTRKPGATFRRTNC